MGGSGLIGVKSGCRVCGLVECEVWQWVDLGWLV